MYGLVGGNPARYPGMEWNNAPYFASKHGLQGITHYFGARLAPFGVCVNSICPGMFPNTENKSRPDSGCGGVTHRRHADAARGR